MNTDLRKEELEKKPRITREEAYSIASISDLASLLKAAKSKKIAGHGSAVSYSRKVFIPLTHLCRDVCHYCTFAKAPRSGGRAYLTADEAVQIARNGKAAGCKEALFTLGDKPELRYRAARDELASMGYKTTIDYLVDVARRVFNETGLLPHANPGVLTEADLLKLREVSVSQGIMLETLADRLCEKGQPHFGSPDKIPAVRLQTLRDAGRLSVPMTTGILIGIGETRQERIDALFALRDLNDEFGHIQEIIVQNFRPKRKTKMALAPAADTHEHLWTLAIARLIFDADMNIQAPPNLSPFALTQLLSAGINDWGGVSPVTPDHVNPEAPWPELDLIEQCSRSAGGALVERLALYPAYVRSHSRWVDRQLSRELLRHADGDGFANPDIWSAGSEERITLNDAKLITASFISSDLQPILNKAQSGRALKESEIVELFRARGSEFTSVCRAADELRKDVNGDAVTYVVTRNINYTNICYFKCQFCAFSKGKLSENLRDRPYDLSDEEMATRVREAWGRGATEVCIQGGIHPDYSGQKYLDLCKIVKTVAPNVHLHAFSPLEIFQGAKTLGIPIPEFLAQLRDAGLNTLPGTAAEILDDEVRADLCPDKITTNEWLNVMAAAHGCGLRSTATIMFGHIDRYEHWARHLLRIRHLQAETGGFTEFVPLPFVHMQSPIFLKGKSRRGPTFREAVLMHAISRLVLHGLIPNIQASWVKLGIDGVKYCLSAGVNDFGGTLMNETISRSAGANHGQEMRPETIRQVVEDLGRSVRQRTTTYGAVESASSCRAPDQLPRTLCLQ